MKKDILFEEFKAYDSENDPSGAYGHKLADLAMERFGGDLKKIREWANSSEKTHSLKRRSNFDYALFGRMVGSINVENIFVQRDSKQSLLEKCGQKRATIRRGKSIFLSDVTDARIGEIVKSRYRTYQKRIEKFNQ